MTASATPVWETWQSATRQAVPFLRHALVSVLRDHGHHALTDTAGLLASELVTNAIQHALAPLGAVGISLTIHPDRIRVGVTDDDPRVPLLRYASGNETHGRGIAIVDAFADKWGVDYRDGRKAVWFELPYVAPEET
ncbi:ATP-binding protein [Uniformispora flossi]|uniref:ATP-binding protein n=1 Tax=Uniformispora flossi TaxID=3390723 RepID=UPI003C2E7F9C